jgi:hypothetical protein
MPPLRLARAALRARPFDGEGAGQNLDRGRRSDQRSAVEKTSSGQGQVQNSCKLSDGGLTMQRGALFRPIMSVFRDDATPPPALVR